MSKRNNLIIRLSCNEVKLTDLMKIKSTQVPCSTRHHCQDCRFAELSMFKVFCLNPAVEIFGCRNFEGTQLTRTVSLQNGPVFTKKHSRINVKSYVPSQMIRMSNGTKVKLNCDPLYSNFRRFGYMENIPGKRTPHISSVIYRVKFRITAIMSLHIRCFLFWVRSAYFRK